MWAKISSIYNMDGFKQILAFKGGNLAVFSNIHMKATIALGISGICSMPGQPVLGSILK